MPDSRSTGRRTVCQRAGSLALTLVGAATIAGSTAARAEAERTDGPTNDCRGEPLTRAPGPAERMADSGAPSTDGLECYRGVVDRIVDDRFVVILLEEDGEVVGELVEPRTDLPPLAESDRVLVVLRDGELHAVLPHSITDEAVSLR